jgi:hypothetical protein
MLEQGRLQVERHAPVAARPGRIVVEPADQDFGQGGGREHPEIVGIGGVEEPDLLHDQDAVHDGLKRRDVVGVLHAPIASEQRRVRADGQ